MADAFSYKLTSESELFGFDFSQVLQSGEIINSATSSILVMSGTDPNPTAMLIGGVSVTGAKANQRVAGGISDVTYRLVVTALTSYGNTYTAVGDLPVYDPSLV